MTMDSSQNDIEAFYAFLGRKLEDGPMGLTPEDSVHEFRAYQAEVRRLRCRLATSHQESLDGKATELDADALMERVRGRLAQQGNTG